MMLLNSVKNQLLSMVVKMSGTSVKEEQHCIKNVVITQKQEKKKETER